MGTKDLIKKHKRIMFDTSPIIYLIEEHKDFWRITDEIFEFIESNEGYHSFSSVITITEVFTHPLRKLRNEIVEKYRKFLLNSSIFTIYPIDARIAEEAAELRAKYNIKTPDALQIAVGIEYDGTLFITNDKNLKSIDEMEIFLLEEYL